MEDIRCSVPGAQELPVIHRTWAQVRDTSHVEPFFFGNAAVCVCNLLCSGGPQNARSFPRQGQKASALDRYPHPSSTCPAFLRTPCCRGWGCRRGVRLQVLATNAVHLSSHRDTAFQKKPLLKYWSTKQKSYFPRLRCPVILHTKRCPLTQLLTVISVYLSCT